jgi:hypothetical protein
MSVARSPGPLPPALDAATFNGNSSMKGVTLQEVERKAFIHTYLSTGKNKARTARELCISERSVYNLLG